jgi:hypothetical protein
MRTVRILQQLTNAVAHGKIAVIRRYVMDRSTVALMTQSSRELRAESVKGLHIVPSLGLDVEPHGTIGAGFYLLGTTRAGKLNEQQTLYFGWVHGRYLVVRSDYDKTW